MLIGYPVGLALGAVIPPAMVDHQDGHGIDGLLLLQFALAAIAAVFCFGLSSAPPSAPSATAPYRRGNDNLGRDLKSLRRNFGFMTLCNIWGLSVGAIQVRRLPIDAPPPADEPVQQHDIRRSRAVHVQRGPCVATRARRTQRMRLTHPTGCSWPSNPVRQANDAHVWCAGASDAAAADPPPPGLLAAGCWRHLSRTHPLRHRRRRCGPHTAAPRAPSCSDPSAPVPRRSRLSGAYLPAANPITLPAPLTQGARSTSGRVMTCDVRSASTAAAPDQLQRRRRLLLTCHPSAQSAPL